MSNIIRYNKGIKISDTKTKILNLLSENEVSQSEIVTKLDIAQTTVSKQLKELELAELVESKQLDGRSKNYKITKNGKDALEESKSSKVIVLL